MKNEKRGNLGLLVGGGAIGAVVIAAAAWMWAGAEPVQQTVQVPVEPTVVAETEKPEATPKDVEEFLEKISLGNNATIDSIERVIKKRNFEFNTEGGVMAAEGVEISTTSPKVVYTSAEFETAKITQELTELKLMKDGKVVASYKAQKSQATVEKKEKHSEILYREVFPNVDVKYTYDGNLVEEFVIFGAAFKADLKASGADNVEVVSHYPEIKASSSDMTGIAVKGDVTPLAVSPITTKDELDIVHVMVPVATLPPSNAFVQGQKDDKALHYIAAKTLDIQEHGTDISVALPANYIAEAAGTVYLDPSIVNDDGSQHGWTQGRRVVRDSEGTYHVTWMRNANYADNGLTRWRMVYAYGDGTNWTYHGPIALPYANSPTQGDHYHQYYGGLAIDSNDNIYVTWMEHNNPIGDAVWNVYWARGYKENWTGFGKVNGKPVHQYPGALSVDSQDRVHLHYGSPSLVKWAYIKPPVMQWVDLGGQAQGSYHYAEGSATVDNNDNFIIAACYSRNAQILKCTPDFANETGSCEFLGDVAVPPGLSNSQTNGRCHQMSVAVDSNNHIHVVYRYQAYQQWGDEAWGSWRVAYGHHDGTAWVDADSRIFEDNGFNQDNPEIAIDNNDNIHILFTEFSTPSKILYWTGSSPANLVKVGQLAPFSGAQHYANMRWSLHPQDPDGAGPLTGNAVMAENIIEGLYVNDNSELTFFSTGQPLELTDLRTPLDHGFTNQTQPTFEWRRISLDNAQGNTTYTLEIATTPVFGASVIFTQAGITDARFDLSTTATTLSNSSYYYWRVTATNVHGPGPNGFPYEVGIDTDPPSAFNLLDPANGSDPQTKTPTFRWEPSVDN